MAGGPTPVDQLMTEALIRSALGEADADVSGIPAGVRYSVHPMIALHATVSARLDEAAVGQIVIEGELLAFERGWHPPLAG